MKLAKAVERLNKFRDALLDLFSLGCRYPGILKPLGLNTQDGKYLAKQCQAPPGIVIALTIVAITGVSARYQNPIRSRKQCP